MATDIRFEAVYQQGLGGTDVKNRDDHAPFTKIFRDNKTGVNYLLAQWGSANGLTVLVDKDGKPIVT